MANRDWFSNAFGATVEDIRHKLVEEGWFGRTVTPRTMRRGQEPEAERTTFAELFGWGKPDERAETNRTAPNSPEHGHEFDR